MMLLIDVLWLLMYLVVEWMVMLMLCLNIFVRIGVVMVVFMMSGSLRVCVVLF